MNLIFSAWRRTFSDIPKLFVDSPFCIRFPGDVTSPNLLCGIVLLSWFILMLSAHTSVAGGRGGGSGAAVGHNPHNTIKMGNSKQKYGTEISTGLFLNSLHPDD